MPDAITAPAPAAAPSKSAAPTPASSPSSQPAFPSPADSAAQAGDDPSLSIDSRIQSKAKPREDAKPPATAPKKDDTAPTGQPPKKPEGIEAVRGQLTKVNDELKTSKSQIAELERKIQDAEAKGKDTTALSERLAAREKEI